MPEVFAMPVASVPALQCWTAGADGVSIVDAAVAAPALQYWAAATGEGATLAEWGVGADGVAEGPAPAETRERPASERKKVKAGVSRRS